MKIVFKLRYKARPAPRPKRWRFWRPRMVMFFTLSPPISECLNRILEALATLQCLQQWHPRFSLLYQERGHAMTLRDAPRAIEVFLEAVNLNAALVPSWIMLESLYRMNGR